MRVRKSPYPMISVDEAMSMVIEQSMALPTISISSEDAIGHVLAEDVLAREPLPPFPASIMDGYAVISADGPGTYGVVGRITAGVDPVEAGIVVRPGTCAYITTGAKMPEGADAVVKVEDTRGIDDADLIDAQETKVVIEAQVPPNKWIRPIGNDIQANEIVLRQGSQLGPTELGLLATVGVTTVNVYAKARVGVMSTGDELVEPTEDIAGGKIRDSNRTTLLALITSIGGECIDLGIIRDHENTLEASMMEALTRCDVLVTSGGVSMGEADLLKDILKKNGTIHFGRIKMKPGKPTTFATIPVPTAVEGGAQQSTTTETKTKLVFALPGNPVSCSVTTYLFLYPALRMLQGHPRPLAMLPQVEVKVPHPLHLDPERPEYHRAVVAFDFRAGCLVATSTGGQMSSRLQSLQGANALLCLPAGNTSNGTSSSSSSSTTTTSHYGVGSMVTALMIGPIPAPEAGFAYHQRAAAPTDAAVGAVAGPGGTSDSGSACGSGHDHGHDHSHGKGHDHSHDHGHGHGHGHGCGGDSNDNDGPFIITVGLLTVSDRASVGQYEDRSGPALRQLLEDEWGLLPVVRVGQRVAKYRVMHQSIVPDNQLLIQETVRAWSEPANLSHNHKNSQGAAPSFSQRVDLVLTSGGTGFGPRDFTPEAVAPILHRRSDGISQALLQKGLQFTPLAVMSRPVTGTRNQTFVATLPGSVKACRENVEALIPLVPRIVSLMRDGFCQH